VNDRKSRNDFSGDGKEFISLGVYLAMKSAESEISIEAQVNGITRIIRMAITAAGHTDDPHSCSSGSNGTPCCILAYPIQCCSISVEALNVSRIARVFLNAIQ